MRAFGVAHRHCCRQALQTAQGCHRSKQQQGCTPNIQPAYPAVRQNRSRRRHTTAHALTSNDIKNRQILVIDGAPCHVQEFLHVKPGKGSAFVRTKLRNLVTGSTTEKTFRAGEGITIADVAKKDCQYTYNEGSTYVFMDMETYEEVRVARDDAWAKWLSEGMTCTVLFFNGAVISVDPPEHATLKVTHTEPGIKGDTKSGAAMKPATVETGADLQVPLFIEEGMMVKVDTRDGKYLSRAK